MNTVFKTKYLLIELFNIKQLFILYNKRVRIIIYNLIFLLYNITMSKNTYPKEYIIDYGEVPFYRLNNKQL